ncbi:hypothetical protein [Desulfolithobacter sp.]
MGITVSEFPLDVDVAIYARGQGMTTGMGAPNVVRGKSQSGNISARELIREECCDFLCSDYHPSSLLQADPDTLGKRLRVRGREEPAAIDKRMARAGLPVAVRNLILFDNSRPLDSTGPAFIGLLESLLSRSAPSHRPEPGEHPAPALRQTCPRSCPPG